MLLASASGHTHRRARRLLQPLPTRKGQRRHVSGLALWGGLGSWLTDMTAAAPDALTDYTPPSRPGASQPPVGAAGGQVAAQYPGEAPPVLVAGNGPPPMTQLPHSTLPPQLAPASTGRIDPTNPTGVIPSTGTSVYDVDISQFEGSGQMWRRPGSELSDWFNYGFDEVTYPKYLRFKQELEQGARALVSGMGYAWKEELTRHRRRWAR